MPNKDTGLEPETIISASVKVEGDFVSQGNVLIEGGVEGSLRTEKDLRVGEQARISADVFASNAVVAGEVCGNITITGKLELEPSARISGDIRTKNLVVASGAAINGRISMGETTGETKAPSMSSKEETINKPALKLEGEFSETEAQKTKKAGAVLSK